MAETQNNQRHDSDKDLRMAEHTAESRRNDVLNACRRAVECLERFAAGARADLNRADTDKLNHARLIALPGQVLAASAWGAANASPDLGIAIEMAAEYARALEALEAMKGGSR